MLCCEVVVPELIPIAPKSVGDKPRLRDPEQRPIVVAMVELGASGDPGARHHGTVRRAGRSVEVPQPPVIDV